MEALDALEWIQGAELEVLWEERWPHWAGLEVQEAWEWHQFGGAGSSSRDGIRNGRGARADSARRNGRGSLSRGSAAGASILECRQPANRDCMRFSPKGWARDIIRYDCLPNDHRNCAIAVLRKLGGVLQVVQVVCRGP